MRKQEYHIGDYVLVDPGTYRGIEYELNKDPVYVGIYHLSQSEIGQICDIITTKSKWRRTFYHIALQDCVIETYAKDIMLFE